LSTKATGSDGKLHKTVVDAPALVYVAFASTYGAAPYREFDAAVRAGLAGDIAPMARLVAEDYFPGPTGSAQAYSEGLDAAVACQDYPQLYDMTASPAVRAGQYEAAIQDRERTDPGTYGPFTIREYLASFWEEQDWCLQWPVADPAHAAGPPMPPGGHYAAVPTLVLSGELDSITTPAEGALVAAQIPGARQVMVANSFHVTAEDDTDGCGRDLVQAFVHDPTGALPASALECARSVPPVRASPTYTRSFQDNGSGSARERAAQTVALTAADVMDRWWESIAGFGTGLRGGTWTSNGDHTATLHLKGYRLADDLAVTGDVVWGRYASTASIDLRFDQVDANGRVRNIDHVDGHLTGTWDTRKAGARVQLTGTQGGQPVTYGFIAP
jgi:pimeloyl-ACP methyl ester carboxylesterase